TDRSLKICNFFAQKDHRIRVIHQENMGLSRTRNKGMKLATGSYIAFLDSDDYVEPSMIETLLEASLINQADICECGMYVHKVNGSIITIDSKRKDQFVIQETSDLIYAYTHGNIKITPWNKLYKLSEISDFLFDPNCIREEADYTLRLCLAHKRFVVINDFLYHYIERQSTSLTRKKISDKIFTLQNWGENMRNQIKLLGNDYQVNADIVLYNSLAHILKHFMRDYKKKLILSNEFQQEIHLVVNRLLELLISVNDISVFRDFDNVMQIMEDLIMMGILKQECLIYWEQFLNKVQFKKVDFSRSHSKGRED
ncbi:MAG: glycosyltransferase, partial [Bacilli bacterium]|nr:glycosyltransferase [Bacilli bacterium]